MSHKMTRLDLLQRHVARKKAKPQDVCVRSESEDDDGYDPYSDRLPEKERLFEVDPWK